MQNIIMEHLKIILLMESVVNILSICFMMEVMFLIREHCLSYIIKHYNNCISFNIPWGGHACSGSINCIYKIKRIIR